MSRASKKAGSAARSKTKLPSSPGKRSSRKKKTAKAPLATRDTAAVAQDAEPMSQVTLKMRESQHRQLAKMAFNQGTTMRGVIMRALKAAGLKVTKQDLVDRRRR